MTMKVLRRRLTTTAVAVATLASTLAFAQDSALAKRVDLFLKDADLLLATQMLTRQTGIQFIIAPTSDPFPKINLSLSGKTAEEAIQYLCQAAGAWAERDDSGVFIIRKGEKPAAPVATTPGVKAPSIIKKIKLLHGDPKAIYEQLTTGYVLDPDRGFKEINAFMRQNNGLSQLPGSNVYVVGSGNYGPTAQPISNHNQSIMANPNVDNGGNVLLPGETGQLSPGGRGGGGQGGLGQGGGLGGGLGQGGGGQGAGQGAGQLNFGQGLLSGIDGIDGITYDPTDNSFVVRGTDEAIRKLQQLISLFDVAPKQVIIKVEFITTSQSVARSLGFDWLYQRGSVFTGNRPGSFIRSGDPIFLNYSTGNIITRMRTLLSEGYGKVVNAPLVRTLNNQTAAVAQAVQTTIFTNQVINGAGGVTTVPVLNTVTVTTGLVVRPRINDDGYITMTLTPQIQDFGQLKRGPDGQEVPDQLSQTINVVARVKSGNTIALAGLTRKQVTNSTSRFPILADLPIVGQFFRSNSTQRNDSELIIFVTPYVVEDDDAGGLGPQ